jgi:site-specific recombinase XerC
VADQVDGRRRPVFGPRAGTLGPGRRLTRAALANVTGRTGRTRVVKISYDAARAVDRYLRVRARHAQAHRAGLWLGAATGGR